MEIDVNFDDTLEYFEKQLLKSQKNFNSAISIGADETTRNNIFKKTIHIQRALEALRRESELTYLSETKEYLVDTVSADDTLSLIAEESMELGQAALKLRRTLSKTNPTPKQFDEAFSSLLEEFADVCNVMQLVIESSDEEDIKKTLLAKRKRWINRLKEKEIEDDD